MPELTRLTSSDIFVWAGMHGEEDTPGIPLVHSLKGSGIESDIANPQAVAQGTRCATDDKVNLSLCIANPQAYPGTYEAALAASIIERSRTKRLVVDVHNQLWLNRNVAFVGARVQPYVLGFIGLCGIDTIIVGGDSGIPSRLPQAVLIDVHKGGKLDDVDRWHSILGRTLVEGLASPGPESFNLYTHTNLTVDEHTFAIPKGKRYIPLQEKLPAAVGDILTVHDRPLYALFGGGWEVAAPISAEEAGKDAATGTLILPTLRNLHIDQ